MSTKKKPAPAAVPTPSSSQPSTAQKRFEIALQCRNMEIDLFWKRSTHYWVFVGAALVAYGALRKEHPTTGFLISSFGVVSAIAWMISAAGAKWWIENWETKLEREAVTIGAGDLFVPEKNISRGSWFAPTIRFSVTRPTIIVSQFVGVLWLAIFSKELFERWANISPVFRDLWSLRESVIAIITGFFATALFFARGKNRRQESPK